MLPATAVRVDAELDDGCRGSAAVAGGAGEALVIRSIGNSSPPFAVTTGW